jgi:hypothetical protein
VDGIFKLLECDAPPGDHGTGVPSHEGQVLMVGMECERAVPKEVSQLLAADEDCVCFGLYGRPFKLNSSQRLANKRNRLPDVVDDLKENAPDAVGRGIGVEADRGDVVGEAHEGASGYRIDGHDSQYRTGTSLKSAVR